MNMKWILSTAIVIGAMSLLSGCTGMVYEETYCSPPETIVVYDSPRPIIVPRYTHRPVTLYRPPQRVYVPAPAPHRHSPVIPQGHRFGGERESRPGRGRR